MNAHDLVENPSHLGRWLLLRLPLGQCLPLLLARRRRRCLRTFTFILGFSGRLAVLFIFRVLNNGTIRLSLDFEDWLVIFTVELVFLVIIYDESVQTISLVGFALDTIKTELVLVVLTVISEVDVHLLRGPVSVDLLGYGLVSRLKRIESKNECFRDGPAAAVTVSDSLNQRKCVVL